MAEPTTSESSSADTDRDFDANADVMVHDYDDERTLEEEEAMSNGDSVTNELDDLQKESEMPLEDLLAAYHRHSAQFADARSSSEEDLVCDEDLIGAYQQTDLTETRSSSEEEILSNQDLTLDKDQIARDLLRDEVDDKVTSADDLMDSVMELPPSEMERMLRSNNQGNSSEDDSEDGDYEPEHDDSWKKTIQVGSDYQAMVPHGMSRYGDAPAYENEDRLLWDPNKLNSREVDGYLKEVEQQNQQTVEGIHSIPVGIQVRDDEQALYLLLQCGHNVDEALRRRKMQAVLPTDPMSLWSEEECQNFETGLRMYGKEFYLIQQNKVRTRSVGELIQFYYLWKKTERHDVFANKTRLEKKKYALHPGITDYMDRFLDEQENPVAVRDRSSSPSVNSLIYADPKRQSTDAPSLTPPSCKLPSRPTRVHTPPCHTPPSDTPPSHTPIGSFRPISDPSLSCDSEPCAKKAKTDLSGRVCPISTPALPALPALPVGSASDPTTFTRLSNYSDCVALSLAGINSSVKILSETTISPILSTSPSAISATESVVR